MKRGLFSKRKNRSDDDQYSYVSHLVAITVQELQIETERIEDERKVTEAMWAARRRANLEVAAAKEGLTVEEYEGKRAKRAEVVRLEREDGAG